MRGLLKAFLLAPAAVSAFVLPLPSSEIDEKIEQLDSEKHDNHASALVQLDVSQESKSPDDSKHQKLGFRLDVLPSSNACGFGNLTLDGQVLPQNLDANALTSSGKGSVSTSTRSVVVGSWSFECIVVNGKPDAQLMTFMLDFVDGKTMEDIGFSVLFKQTGETAIMNIENLPTANGHVIAKPSPQHFGQNGKHHNEEAMEDHHHGPETEGKHHKGPHPHEHHMDFDILREVHELHYMEAQLEELEYLIREKKFAIDRHAHRHMDDSIRDCDSIRCVASKTFDATRGAASKIYGKITGEHMYRKHKGRKGRHSGKGKGFHSRGSNHTCPHHHERNHTSHHGHHPKRPVLPVCHYPPPPPSGPHAHGGFEGHPNDIGYHHPKPHMPPPDFEDIPHREDLEDFGPPKHGEKSHHRRPHADEDFENFEEIERQRHDHGPSSFNDHHHEKSEEIESPRHDHGPPSFDGHRHEHFEDEFESPRHGSHESQAQHRPSRFDRPHSDKFEDGPHIPDGALPEPEHDEHEKPFHHPFKKPHDEHKKPLHHPFDGPHDKHHGPPHPRVFEVFNYVMIGFCFVLLIAICRYIRSSSRQSFFARLTGRNEAYLDYDEKDGFVDSDNESISGDVTTLRNSANLVSEIVAAEEGRSAPNTQVQTQITGNANMEMNAMIIDDCTMVDTEEVLPAYEDNDHDGSEASSFVADGFRYTPGSSEYSPERSADGGAGDILGDTKQ